MGDIARSRANIRVNGIPEEWTREQKVALLDAIEATGQPFRGSYEQATQLAQNAPAAVQLQGEQTMEEARPQPSALQIAQSTDNPPDALRPPTGYERFVGAPQAQMTATEDTTDVAGVLGGVVRGAGPYAAGAAAGAAIGAPIGGVGAIPGAAAGAVATLAAQIVTPLFTNFTNTFFGTNVPSPREAWKQLFTKMGVAEPDSKVEQLFQETSESVAATVATGGLATAAGAMPALESGARAMQETLMRIVPQMRDYMGALAGPGAGMALEAGAKAVGAGPGMQTVANIGGNLLGDVGATGITDIATSPATRNLANAPAGLEAAEVAGRRIMTSDVLPPKTKLQEAIQLVTETLPFGPGRMRAGQQAERVTAVKTMLSEFGVDDFTDAEITQALTEDLANNFLNVRSGALTKWSNQKAEVVESLSDIEVDVEPTRQLIQAELDRLIKLGDQDMNPFINKLSNWMDMIGAKNIEDLETHRRTIGQAFNDPGLAGVKDEVQKVSNKVYGSLRDDIHNFVLDNSDAGTYQKWDEANRELSSLMSDLEDGVISTLLSPAGGGRTAADVTPERINRLVLSKDKSSVEAIYNRLDDEGKELMQMSVLANMAQDATLDVSGLSPTRFANLVGKQANELGVVLSEENHQMMKGLKEYLDLTARAETVANRSPLQRSALALAAGAVPGGTYQISRLIGSNPLVAAIIGVGSFGAASGSARIYESPRVRNLLLELSNTSDADKAARLGRQITRILDSATQDPRNRAPAGAN